MARIKDHYMEQIEVANMDADRFSFDDTPGSDAYHNGIIAEAAVSMYDRIENLEVIIAQIADYLNADNPADLDEAIAAARATANTMRSLMLRLDR